MNGESSPAWENATISAKIVAIVDGKGNIASDGFADVVKGKVS